MFRVGAAIAPTLFYYTYIMDKRKRIYLNTPTASLGRAPTVRIARMAMAWCRKHIGENPRKHTRPLACITKSYSDDTICGEYDCYTNEIYVYWNKCDNVREVISTCIHEWTHQMQPIRSKYFNYPGTYSRNPFERQARYAEMKWTPVLWKEIKDKVNKN